MIQEIKRSQPEVEASKSDKRLRSYGRLKICIISHQFWVYIDALDLDNKRCRHLIVAMQPTTLNIFYIPGCSKLDMEEIFSHMVILYRTVQHS